MLLPNGERAIIDPIKIRDYCLNMDHARGKNKAKVFQSRLGLTRSRFGVLCDALAVAARESEALSGISDWHGRRFVIDFELSVDNRQAVIRSAWIIRTGEDIPRFVTCYVV